jgi:hypothetical protein
MLARKSFFAFALLLVSSAQAAPPAGNFNAAQCLDCHSSSTPKIVADWRGSAHGGKRPGADCVACHGRTHKDALPKSRRVSTCTACHSDASPAVHSYATSKHGIIVRLEEDAWDWSKPLRWGNYRSPTCAYCHLHQGGHDMGSPLKSAENSVDSIRSFDGRQQQPCRDCHSPRYVAEQFASGDRALAIAGMKLREAQTISQTVEATSSVASRSEITRLLSQMQDHVRNVRIGVAHQSPDYQWWHGQPALDGDLLRIKGAHDVSSRGLPAGGREKQ